MSSASRMEAQFGPDSGVRDTLQHYIIQLRCMCVRIMVCEPAAVVRASCQVIRNEKSKWIPYNQAATVSADKMLSAGTLAPCGPTGTSPPTSGLSHNVEYP